MLGGEGQALGVVRHECADEQDQNDVEEHDSPKGQLDSFGDHFRWVLRFSDCDANEFSSEIGEGRGYESSPKSKESAAVASCETFFESSRIFPVAEALGYRN